MRNMFGRVPGLALAAMLSVLWVGLGTAQAADPSRTAQAISSVCIAAPDASRASGEAGGDDLVVPMRRTAEKIVSDPSGLWTDWEIWNPYQPRGTDIWAGVVPACDGGRYIVTQFVNRQCSSEAVCPARVLHEDARGARRVLIGYKQICMTHETFRLHRDGGRLTACDHPFEWNQRP